MNYQLDLKTLILRKGKELEHKPVLIKKVVVEKVKVEKPKWCKIWKTE